MFAALVEPPMSPPLRPTPYPRIAFFVFVKRLEAHAEFEILHFLSTCRHFTESIE